jgi:hypothetical protein
MHLIVLPVQLIVLPVQLIVLPVQTMNLALILTKINDFFIFEIGSRYIRLRRTLELTKLELFGICSHYISLQRTIELTNG